MAIYSFILLSNKNRTKFSILTEINNILVLKLCLIFFFFFDELFLV